MRYFQLFFLAVLAVHMSGTAQAAIRRRPPAGSACQLAAGSRMDATLRTSLDTRYTVVPSSVVALLQHPVKRHGRMLLPKGTQVLGKVLESSPARHGKPAQLEILFNQALLPDGTTLPLTAGISALFTRARRAVLDGDNGLDPAGDRIRRPEGPHLHAGAFPPGGHRPDMTDASPDAPAALTDPDAAPAERRHGPDLLRDSDGVPLRIEPGDDTGANRVPGGSVLIGRGSTIRLHAGTRIQIRVANAVPLPGRCSHP